MAKKKTIELRSAGADVPSGDVNISYNGVRIAGFSEDTDATLKTGMKRVEHDIDIEYTKPSGGTPIDHVQINVTFSGPDSDFADFYGLEGGFTTAIFDESGKVDLFIEPGTYNITYDSSGSVIAGYQCFIVADEENYNYVFSNNVTATSIAENGEIRLNFPVGVTPSDITLTITKK